MTIYEEKTAEFHGATGSALDRPLSSDLLALRKSLLAEEMKELFAEIDGLIADNAPTPERIAALIKEMADVQYVLSGMAVTFGLPLEEVFMRVHESNLSKFDESGKPILRADGKVLKGPRYHPPRLDDISERIFSAQASDKETSFRRRS